jgi:GTP pyrophosphokinase
VIEVAWGQPGHDHHAVYPMDVVVEAGDRPGLLRDITEVFAKEKINVTGVHTQSTKDRSSTWMTFTVEATDAARLPQVLAQVIQVPGVRHAGGVEPGRAAVYSWATPGA